MGANLWKRSEPWACVCSITQEMAKAMLATSPGNRKIRPSWVKWLAASMRRGEWRVTSQGIGFDLLGRLRDGHHRLCAIIEAAMSIPSVVVLGLAEDAYEVIDVGIKRTVGDSLDIPRPVADVMSLAGRLVFGSQRASAKQLRILEDAGLRWFAAALVDMCSSRTKYFASAPMKLAACVVAMEGGDPAHIQNQYAALCRLDYGAMSPVAQSLARQVQVGDAVSTDRLDTLARGLKVFDQGNANLVRLSIRDGDCSAAAARVRALFPLAGNGEGEG